MCAATRTILLTLLGFLSLSLAAPLVKTPQNSTTEVEESLEHFLEVYYDRYVKRQVEEHVQHLKMMKSKNDTGSASDVDIYETMQGDQPVVDNRGLNPGQYRANFSGIQGLGEYRMNVSDQYLEAVRNRRPPKDTDDRSKENFIKFLKNNILEHLGRGNVSTQKIDDARISALNISEIMPTFLNSTNLLSDDQITEKIRSFYPSCEVPVNTDQELWKDDDIMNLFFNFEYISNDRNTNIATATLRLYRLPENGTQFNIRGEDCDDINTTEEEKLLRVSIYWYTKSLKKRRVKRRLADSKVIPEHLRWVELSVKPAAKAWTKGRNLGLGVLVEDQDGNMLRADRYFKGASCTQPPSQSPPSSSTRPANQTNLTELIAYLEEIQRQPNIVTYTCSQP